MSVRRQNVLYDALNDILDLRDSAKEWNTIVRFTTQKYRKYKHIVVPEKLQKDFQIRLESSF